MTFTQSLTHAWASLPPGARAAVEQQWAGLVAGGLPCGSAVVDASGQVLTAGRNHAYGPAGELETRLGHPLQHTRLAHAELNALALFFLFTSAVEHGERARNLRLNRERHPELIGLTLRLGVDDSLGRAARSGMTLLDALTPHTLTVMHIAELAPR